MPRRSHKKSRAGCSECKRRHLKCDETKPKCINCVTAHLRCPYEDEPRLVSDYAPSLSHSQEVIRENSNASSPTTSRSPSSTVNVFSPPQVLADSTLNMLHLELLHHWSYGFHDSFLLSSDDPYQKYSQTCITHGLRNPFLMRQILATSALHICITHPNQRVFYHQHATQLQSEALAGFNAILQGLNESNIVPAFLVSSLIAMHVFCDTFLFREESGASFNSVLDSLIGCINLLRGVRSVIHTWWTFLCESELGPILVSAQNKRHAHVERVPVNLAELNRMIDIADIGAASREAYKEAVLELENVFAAQTDLPELESRTSAQMIFAWLVIIPKGYVELLSARRPEALVILSYYAVNLHYRRKFWAINDAGSFLIQGISSHLGKHWEQWLAWPKQVIVT